MRQQLLLPLRIGAQKLQLRLLRFDVVTGGIDLRLRQIALRRQFGGFELHDRIAGFQAIAFARENFFHATGHARGDMHFVDFDRAGNGIRRAAGRREKEKRRSAEEKRAVTCKAREAYQSRQGSRKYGWIFRHAARAQTRHSA